MNRNNFAILKYFLPVQLFFFLCSNTSAQKQIKKYIEDNTISISTISPDSTDFSDLEIIGNAIGDSKIVMLGEQDHGDASAFLAKTRIVKYLHEKKGFNVLAFESDFFGLNYGWDRTEKPSENMDTFISKNVFGAWSHCPACFDLFYSYIPKTYKTNQPLIISGFDSQVYYQYSKKYLGSKLDSVLRALDLPITRRPEYSQIAAKIDSFASGQIKYSDKECMAYLTEMRKEVSSRINANDFWLLVIDNLIQLNFEYQNIKNINDFSRDSMMAVNLKWLAENKFKDEKIIVWAASYHIAKFIHGSKIKINSTMGDFFSMDSSLVNRSYILGFTSFKGTTGFLNGKKYKVQKPKRDGFENWIDTAFKFSFVDFKRYNRENPMTADEFYLKGNEHYNMKRQWNKIFDGVFFIREMYPCTK
jgi:erythromycin esterase